MSEVKKILNTGPGWLQNSSSTFPQTIYNMYMSLSNNLAGEQASSAAFEMQAQAIILACLGEKAWDFILNRWNEYYNFLNGESTQKTDLVGQTKDAIRNNIWLWLAGEALEQYNKKYAGDGYVCKTAVTWIPANVKVECLHPGAPNDEEKAAI